MKSHEHIQQSYFAALQSASIPACSPPVPITLDQLGWDTFYEEAYATTLETLRIKGIMPGRICREDVNRYVVWTEEGQIPAQISGRLRHQIRTRRERPAVGDWVIVKKQPEEENQKRNQIHAMLPRKGFFSRGGIEDNPREQVVATNVDASFIVCGMDGEFNARRLDRYLALARHAKSEPIILLNKMDLIESEQEAIDLVAYLAGTINVHTVSATHRRGLDSITQYFEKGKTFVLLGSSGVGKSSLINALASSELQETSEVRESDRRGRHTTKTREMFLLENGGLLIDTPGLRELQLIGTIESIKEAFPDIQQLALECRFTDCRHMSEPDCAVKRAVENGELHPGRLESYHRMLTDLESKEEIEG